MKKKLFIWLLILSVGSILVSSYVIVTIGTATRDLQTLIQLHEVAVLREKMLDQINVVQQDLHLKQTRHARDVATLVAHVETMSDSVASCFNCHHSKEVTAKLTGLRDKSETYKQALSRVYTIRANILRLRQEENNAFLVGEKLIEDVNEMLRLTHINLGIKTHQVLEDVRQSRMILTFLTFILPLLVISIAIWFFTNFTKTITSLVDATNRLKTGDLDFRITGLKDEFGEVAHSFNEMAQSLREVMQNKMHAEQMVLMGEMASRLAHEIKNPITGIKLATEVLRDEAGLEEEFKDLCRKTINQIKGIEKLMKGLLNFAKPPAPHFEIESLKTIIDTTWSTIEVLIGERSRKPDGESLIHLVKELDEELPPIMTDASQVQQILLNLMLNALDAMPTGGTLTVRSYATPVDGFLRVDISDTGHGFSPQEGGKIFQPFYSTKIKGTGLGLAIVTRLVDLLGGKLHFASEEAVGTTFTVCLPIEQSKGVEKNEK